MSRNFKDIVKDFQHALNISYQNTRNIVKVSERYLAELAEAEQSGGGGVDYSTTEQDTGLKWIDGKTIYQKTITLDSETSISNTEWTSLGVTAASLNIDKYINVCAIANNGTCWAAVSVATVNSNISLTAWRNGDTIAVKYVTIQYTKAS